MSLASPASNRRCKLLAAGEARGEPGDPPAKVHSITLVTLGIKPIENCQCLFNIPPNIALVSTSAVDQRSIDGPPKGGFVASGRQLSAFTTFLAKLDLQIFLA